MENNKNSSKKQNTLRKWLRLKKKSQLTQDIPKLKPGESAQLSYGQQRLWLLQQQHPENTFYHYTEAYRLKGAIDYDRLYTSIKKVIRRHDIFKTTFQFHDGDVVQIVGPDPLFELTTHSLNHLPVETRVKKAEEHAIYKAQKPFDLENGPLMRIDSFILSDKDALLVFTLHHIITDKWSMRLFREELSKFYRAPEHEDHSQVLPPLPIQYADFSMWQRQLKINDQHLRYWSDKLSGCADFLPLPTDYPRPSKQSFRGAFYQQKFTSELAAKLKILSRQLDTTMFVLLLSAFKVLLFRYTGLKDILVGSPFTNRDRSVLEQLIGFFNDTLVLRSDLSGNPSFLSLVQQVRETTLEGFSKKSIPFEKLIQELKPNRMKGTNPLFQVMFLYHVEPEPLFLNDEVSFEIKPLDLGVSKFDLTLYIAEEGDQLTAIFEYATDLFAEESIIRMMRNLLTLLEQIVFNPEYNIDQIPIISQDQIDQQIISWNSSPSIKVSEKCVHELFEKQSKINPDKIAVIANEKQLNYAELNNRSKILASELIRYGSGTNIPIGLCVDRSVEMLIGILGIHQSGSCYLPIDPNYPDERIYFMLEDANVPIIVCQDHLKYKFEDRTVKIVTFKSVLESQSAGMFEFPNVESENLAYLIYTSGSTGNPKGVAVTHSNLLHSTVARSEFYPDQPGCFLLLSSFAFDSSKAGIFWTIISGGTLVIPEFRIEQDMEKLGNIIADNRVSHMLLLPSLYDILLQHVQQNKLESLKTVIVAGEACPGFLCKKHFDKLPNVHLYNEYGPTEATVWSSVHKIQPDDAKGNIPIGRPIANTQLYILDKHSQPVPIGVPGELHIGGKNISNGYINHPEMTDQVFIENPFSDKPLEKLYKTGDLVKYRPNGIIDFLGRTDQQVKVRGYRIELNEIKEKLINHEAILEAIVIVHSKVSTAESKQVDEEIPSAEKRKQIAAYYTSKQNQEIPSLIKYLNNHLPEYMIPSSFNQLESFPRLPNGKINIKKLPKPKSINQNLHSNFTAPRNEIELKLAKIWSNVLQVKKLGIYDNFFDVGGDSILSIQITAKARNENIYLAPNHIFEHQTISELALYVKDVSPKTESQLSAIGTFPLTPIQHWFFEIHKIAPHHWNQILHIATLKEYGPGILEKAIWHLVHHHDALRQRFINIDGEWTSEIQEKNAASIFHQKIVPIGQLQNQKAIIHEELRSLQSQMDLSKGGLFQAVLFHTPENDLNKLYLIAHHLIMDGISWSILLDDLQLVCNQLTQGGDVQLPPKSTSFRQWSEFVNSLAEKSLFDEQLSYWEMQSGRTKRDAQIVPAVTIIMESDIETINYSIKKEIVKSLLEEVPRVYEIRPDELILAALVLSINAHTGRNEISIGLEKHGREQLDSAYELSNTVGWFTSSFPLLLNVDPKLDIDQNLKKIKEQIRGVPDGGIGYGVLKYLSKEEKLRKEAPQVLFNYMGSLEFLHTQWKKIGFEFENSRSPKSERENMIELNVFGSNGELHCVWSFHPLLISKQTISQWIKSFEIFLERLIANCLESKIGGFTPSDFPEAEISQDDLDHLLDQI